MTVSCALFTALIIIGGYISIPLGPVPLVLADFFIMLTGLFLGAKYGLVSVSLYLGLGTLGMPVFAGGKAGLAVFMGPTGGFLFGYVLAVIAIGLIAGSIKAQMSRIIMALVVGNILLYSIGVPWLKGVMHLSWSAALAIGLVPFLAGIFIKIIAVSVLARAFLPRFRQTFVVRHPNDDQHDKQGDGKCPS